MPSVTRSDVVGRRMIEPGSSSATIPVQSRLSLLREAAMGASLDAESEESDSDMEVDGLHDDEPQQRTPEQQEAFQHRLRVAYWGAQRWLKPRLHNTVNRQICVTSMAAGGLCTLYLDTNGTVWSGRTEQDDRGFIDATYVQHMPRDMRCLLAENFRAVHIAAGREIAAAVSDNGELEIWGLLYYVPIHRRFFVDQEYYFLDIRAAIDRQTLPDVERFINVAAGKEHVVILTSHGNVYTFDRREARQLPVTKMILGDTGTRAVTISAGNGTSFAVDDQGIVWGWGKNDFGLLGVGGQHDGSLPKKVLGLGSTELSGERIVQIAGGTNHTLFLDSAGHVYGCGLSASGQLGLSPTHDYDLPMLLAHRDLNNRGDPVVQIAASDNHSAALTRSGKLYMWGSGLRGQLGLGWEKIVRTPRRVRVSGDKSVIAVSCSEHHTIALFDRGEGE